PYVEAYKKLQLNIQYSSLDKDIKVIEVTSTEANEGKTITAVNLAATYTLKNKKAIIIDLDLRKPKIHKIFNIHNENGIVDVVTENTKFEDAVYHHESGVDVLVRGSNTPQVELFLESDKLANFINELKEKYDTIILDCPPTTVVTDSILISKNTDGIVFVVAYNKVKKDLVKDSIKRLTNVGANILGVVMTQVEKTMNKKYSKYTYYSKNYQEGGK
ncbi:MAG: CpsD/CapB family tyrosine-protein kinase, partial [Bacilli bacterium]|nr:CpsD/CapB family tyrosine-protein kinase [Bacilli bacterium]